MHRFGSRYKTLALKEFYASLTVPAILSELYKQAKVLKTIRTRVVIK